MLPTSMEKEDIEVFFQDTRLKKGTCPGKRGCVQCSPKHVYLEVSAIESSGAYSQESVNRIAATSNPAGSEGGPGALVVGKSCAAFHTDLNYWTSF